MQSHTRAPASWSSGIFGHTVYSFSVTLLQEDIPMYENSQQCSFLVKKRYNDFFQLHQQIVRVLITCRGNHLPTLRNGQSFRQRTLPIDSIPKL